MRIIPHLYWALNFEYDAFVALTNNTDVLVLLPRLCNILKNQIEKSLIKDWDKHTVPYCPWTCKHLWRETVPKPIESSHIHWVQLAKKIGDQVQCVTQSWFGGQFGGKWRVDNSPLSQLEFMSYIKLRLRWNLCST